MGSFGVQFDIISCPVWKSAILAGSQEWLGDGTAMISYI